MEEAKFKRIRTVTEDSGIEEDINNDHFVTEVEFNSVIEIIQTCQYLSDEHDNTLTPAQLTSIIEKYCIDSDEDLKDILEENMDKIKAAKLNSAQLMALLEDVQDIYDEPRNKYTRRDSKIDLADIGDFDDSDEEEEDELEAKLDRLTDMGFNREEAETALENANNNINAAVELLMPSSSSSTSTVTASSINNPLAFLRDIDEFQFLRYQVLHDPKLLQPLLISFGQSHPQIMKTINENKDIFISMLYEQTGAKLTGRH